MRLAVTKATEQLPPEFKFVFDVTPDLSVFAYVLGVSVFAGLFFGLAPALASSRSALFAVTEARAPRSAAADCATASLQPRSPSH